MYCCTTCTGNFSKADVLTHFMCYGKICFGFIIMTSLTYAFYSFNLLCALNSLKKILKKMGLQKNMGHVVSGVDTLVVLIHRLKTKTKSYRDIELCALTFTCREDWKMIRVHVSDIFNLRVQTLVIINFQIGLTVFYFKTLT